MARTPTGFSRVDLGYKDATTSITPEDGAYALNVNPDAGAPASSTSAARAGDIAVADGFLYVCVSANSWQRATLANF